MQHTVNKAITIKKWNGYKFKLYLPASPSKNNKPNIYFYHPDPLTGLPKRARLYKGLSYNYPITTLKQNAKVLVDEVINNLEAGLPVVIKSSDNVSKLTNQSPIISCFDHWLVYRNECFEVGALKKKGYLSSQNISSFFKEWLNDKKHLLKTAPSFNHLDIDLFLQTWAKKRKWNKVSYNTYRGHLITFFNYLIAIKVIADNPARRAKKLNLKNDSSRFVIYEEKELRQVVKALNADDSFFDLYVAAKLIFKYNIRPIELIRVQVKDIDFNKQMLVLSPDKTKNGNEARFSLDEESINLLQKFVGENRSDQYLFGRGIKGSVPRHAMVTWIKGGELLENYIISLCI